MKQQIPNTLTFSRIALIPMIAALFFMESTWGANAVYANIALYIAAALTDYFDGYFARRWKVVSPLGTFLDPISDKIMVACLLVLLIGFGRLEGLWMIPVLVILTREFLISGLREFLGPKNIQVPVTNLAKWKTTLQMLALGLLIAGPLSGGILLAGQIALTAAALITAITGWGYLKAGLAHLRA